MYRKRQALRKSEKGESSYKDLSESNVRKDFIDLIFQILGWDVRNSNEYDSFSIHPYFRIVT